MKNILNSVLAGILFVTIAFGQSEHIKTRRFSQNFASQNTVSSSGLMFHVFTNYEQMAYFFKPAIIHESNAVPVISDKDFVNQFVVAISGSESKSTKPLITTVQAKNKALYVYYEEVKSSDVYNTAVMAVSKDDFDEIIFVDRRSNSQKIIYYNDIPPVIAKIVVSYLDMPQSDTYKHEYQISIDEMGEVIAVRDENGEITSRLNFNVSAKVFTNLIASAVGLDNGGEQIDRDLTKGKNFKEILLLDDSNKVVYSLIWDNQAKVNESTRQFVQTIENLVPERIISFVNNTSREVARN